MGRKISGCLGCLGTLAVVSLIAIVVLTIFRDIVGVQDIQYVRTVAEEDQLVVENTVTKEKSDFFLVRDNGDIELLTSKNEVGGFLLKLDDYTHTTEKVEDSNKVLQAMLETSMNAKYADRGGYTNRGRY